MSWVGKSDLHCEPSNEHCGTSNFLVICKGDCLNEVGFAMLVIVP